MALRPHHRLLLLQHMADLERDVAENELAIAHHDQRRRRRRRFWVKLWLLRRPLLCQYDQLMSELREEDVPAFRNCVRMEPAMFRELLGNAQPQLLEQPQAHLQPEMQEQRQEQPSWQQHSSLKQQHIFRRHIEGKSSVVGDLHRTRGYSNVIIEMYTISRAGL